MGAFGFVTRYVYEKVVVIFKPKMYKSCQSTYYKVAIPIPNPSFDGCIWGCVPLVLVTIRTWSPVCYSVNNPQGCLLPTYEGWV
jgi:hypothetical protein